MNGTVAGVDAHAIGTIKKLVWRIGGISNATALFSLRPTLIRANASSRDTQPQRDSFETSNAAATANTSSPTTTLPTSTPFQPQPLSEDIVVEIDLCVSDADDTVLATPGAVLRSYEDLVVHFRIYPGFPSRAVQQLLPSI